MCDLTCVDSATYNSTTPYLQLQNPQNPENPKEKAFLKSKFEAHLATKLNVVNLYSPLIHQLWTRVGSTYSRWLLSEPYDRKMRISQQKKGGSLYPEKTKGAVKTPQELYPLFL